MQADTFLLQLAIVFLPGLLWARLDANYAMKSKPTDIEFLLRAFQFGLVSYAITYLVYLLWGGTFLVPDIIQAKSTLVLNKQFAEQIIAATAVSLVCAIIWIYISTYKLFTRLLQIIGATNTYGDEDVWDYTFNSNIAAVEYIHFRDFESGNVYAGWVSTWSETGKMRELVLRDVEVYNSEGEKQFSVPLLYIARPPENIFIEFPYIESSTNERQETKSPWLCPRRLYQWLQQYKPTPVRRTRKKRRN